MATTSSKVVVAKGEGECQFPERLICPICFRLPEKEVFQCQDGHVLCSECYNKKTECPQCGGSLVKHQPIRNRFFETELEQFVKVDCSFKSNGCPQKIRKDLLQQHQHRCYFNYEKFGPPFSLCKSMNLSCNFCFNQGNLKEFVDHFIFAHGAKMNKSMEFRMELCNFLGDSSDSVAERNSATSEVNGDTFEFFTPIVSNLEDKECYILTIPMLNTSLDLFQIVSYYLPYFNSERTLINPEMEYSVVENTGSARSLILIGEPRSLSEVKDAGLTARSGCLQMSQLKSYITAGECLLVDCKILLEGIVIKHKSNVRRPPPQVIFQCCNITQVLKKSSKAKRVKVIRLSDFAEDSPTEEYLNRFREALLNSLPGAQKRVFKMIDLMIGSVVHKELGYHSMKFGPDNFQRILYNAMFLVVQYGSVEALKRMLGKNGNGIDWGVVNHVGYTLLQFAMFDGNLERGLEKAQLLQNEIGIKTLDNLGSSLAHWAALRSNDKAMAFVCQLGLDLNAKNKYGETPLHLAMNNLHLVEITAKKVEVLLEHGADPDAKNGEGKTPLDVAASQCNNLLWEKVTGLFQTHYWKKWKDDDDTETLESYLVCSAMRKRKIVASGCGKK